MNFIKTSWHFAIAVAFIIATAVFLEEAVVTGINNEILLDYLTDIPVFAIVALILARISKGIIVSLDKILEWETFFYYRFYSELTIILLLSLLCAILESTIVTMVDQNPRMESETLSHLYISFIIYLFTFFTSFLYYEQAKKFSRYLNNFGDQRLKMLINNYDRVDRIKRILAHDLRECLDTIQGFCLVASRQQLSDTNEKQIVYMEKKLIEMDWELTNLLEELNNPTINNSI